MDVYEYKGPVMYYGKVLSGNWYGQTIADSKKKAVSNLKYQFKNKANLSTSVGGISFTNDVVVIKRIGE